MKRLLFLGKADEPIVQEAVDHLREIGVMYPTVCLGRWGDPYPQEALDKHQVIVSFLSPWIVPAIVLKQSQRAVNFHPGPPEYPGIGAYNFALYDWVPDYGVTCHYMVAKVDTGPIIVVRRFPMGPDDSVASLRKRTLTTMLALWYALSTDITQMHFTPPVSKEVWTRAPYTRADLERLCETDETMMPLEIYSRVRATTYPGHRSAAYPEGWVREEPSRVLVAV